jgi:hypothetical protein
LGKEKFSPELMGGVQLQSALMGLTLVFKKKYGDEAVSYGGFCGANGNYDGKQFQGERRRQGFGSS